MSSGIFCSGEVGFCEVIVWLHWMIFLIGHMRRLLGNLLFYNQDNDTLFEDVEELDNELWCLYCVILSNFVAYLFSYNV